ncbi:hypothetical protein [Nostoc sp. 106C]|jgi:ABC-type transporter Mla subunit MlaD|uniref:hypothetical protein n=1 Tax=Nostoc sp. 106C TaxID=1932667 RepID=UPI001FB755E7|nr:hypothetical protein [Nostoc sp. 106C]
MKTQLEKRLQVMKLEFEDGHKILANYETKQANLQKILLRISGAIQVLQEEDSKISEILENLSKISEVINKETGVINQDLKVSNQIKEQLEQRLQSLKLEFEDGQRILADYEIKQANLQTTLLRISGGIQVLEEELVQSSETSQTSQSIPV